jgi:hypothetical protein
VHIHPDYLLPDEMPLADQVTLFGQRLAAALTESGINECPKRSWVPGAPQNLPPHQRCRRVSCRLGDACQEEPLRAGRQSQPGKLLDRAKMENDHDERDKRQEPKDPGHEPPPPR